MGDVRAQSKDRAILQEEFTVSLDVVRVVCLVRLSVFRGTALTIRPHSPRAR
jgi:hypothetical protein